MILAGIMAKKRGYQAEERVTFKIAMKTFWQAIPSLLLIIIVIGGILAGVFTATEGSAIAVVYATVLSLIYKSFKLKDIPRIVLESTKTTGIITFMIGLSSIMSWAMDVVSERTAPVSIVFHLSCHGLWLSQKSLI